MFVIVPIANGTMPRGSVVHYSTTSSKWELASSDSKPVGILEETTGDETNGWFGRVTFAGTCYAKASRDIPDQGGWLEVENGMVYVDTASTEANGIVAPLPRGQATRLANDLVMVHLR